MITFKRDVKSVSGVFAVDKTDGELRLIFDGRPLNRIFADPEKVELSGPDAFHRLQIPDGEDMYIATCDISAFFHRILVPEWMVQYLALPAVRVGDLPFDVPGFASDDVIHPCCLTLPMGFSASCLISQEIHRFIVSQCPSLKGAREISLADNGLDKVLRYNLFLDDGTFLSTDKAEVDVALEGYIDVMQSHGFPPKWSKVNWASTKGITLGVEFDGRRGSVYLPPAKMVALIADTNRMLRSDCASAHEMQVLLGRWTWAMMPRREALSVFQAAYAFAATGQSSIRLWSTVARELRAAVGLAPLLVSDLRRPWAPWAMASDASLYAQGVTYAAIGPLNAADIATAARVAAKASPPVDDDRAPIGPRPLLTGARRTSAGVRSYVGRSRWSMHVCLLFLEAPWLHHAPGGFCCLHCLAVALVQASWATLAGSTLP